MLTLEKLVGMQNLYLGFRFSCLLLLFFASFLNMYSDTEKNIYKYGTEKLIFNCKLHDTKVFSEFREQ